MKKLIIIFIGLVFLMFFTSCEKNNFLNGTTWNNREKSDVSASIEFGNNDCYIYIKVYGKTHKTVPYDYILNYPKVVMYAKEEGMADLEGTISDNSMSVRNLDKDSYFDTFYKQ